ncbi:hypothetical protein Csa_023603, partial [Cucumis sativus]
EGAIVLLSTESTNQICKTKNRDIEDHHRHMLSKRKGYRGSNTCMELEIVQ